jgi:hypothetical protein
VQAYSVARAIVYGVCAVCDEWDFFALAKIEYLALGCAQNRASGNAAYDRVKWTHGWNSAYAIDSATARKIEYLGFKVVVGIVGGSEYPYAVLLHNLGKKLISRVPRRFFKPLLCAFGK